MALRCACGSDFCLSLQVGNECDSCEHVEQDKEGREKWICED